MLRYLLQKKIQVVVIDGWINNIIQSRLSFIFSLDFNLKESNFSVPF